MYEEVISAPIPVFISDEKVMLEVCGWSVPAGFASPADLPPTNRTKLRLVKSVTMEQYGHEEEQIYRRTDHWLS
jgi:hypothetical protein